MIAIPGFLRRKVNLCRAGADLDLGTALPEFSASAKYLVNVVFLIIQLVSFPRRAVWRCENADLISSQSPRP